jgi:GT2 family glycosyltransferase
VTPPTVGVVVLAYGPEPMLTDVVDAVNASTGVAVDLVVVDNGYRGDHRDALRSRRLAWLAPGRNTGYAGGSNLGAAQATGDAVLAPDALQSLTGALADPAVGIATAQVLLHDEPGVINSAGNPVHYSLLSWAGGWGDAADLHAAAADVASASGCLLMMRRAVFEELAGFHEQLFAYGEDVELSLRAWQAGYRVRYVPQARVWHRYSFQRTAQKSYLLERNRWVNLLTLYQRDTLLRLLPGLVLVEGGIWVTALRQGWLRDKARATAWLVRHNRAVRRRRRWVQGRRRVADAATLRMLELRIEPSPRVGTHVPDAVNAALQALGRRGRAGPSAAPSGQ